MLDNDEGKKKKRKHGFYTKLELFGIGSKEICSYEISLRFTTSLTSFKPIFFYDEA